VQFTVSILLYYVEDIPNVWLCEVLVFLLNILAVCFVVVVVTTI
jgi:hypothetical protein